MKKLIATSSALLVASASAAFASCGGISGGTCTSVPEISALEGTAALAVVAALVLMAWERKRRAA